MYIKPFSDITTNEYISNQNSILLDDIDRLTNEEIMANDIAILTENIYQKRVRTFSWTAYTANPRLCLYSIGLKYPNDFFILFSLYQRR